METTKAYMDDQDLCGLLDIIANQWAKPRKQMIELIDRANVEKMKRPV